VIRDFARGIRARAMAIAVAPALLVALLLILLFARQTLQQAERQLSERAELAARHLAVAAEYGLGSGRWALLARLAAQHRAQGGALYVAIHDRSGALIAASGTPPAADAAHAVRGRAPVTIAPTDLPDDPFTQALALERGAMEVGHVSVVLDDAPVRRARREVWLHGALIVPVAAGLIALLAWRVSRPLAAQIHALTRTVENFREGALDERVAHGGTRDELDQLAAGFNRMAQTIQRDQEELARRVDHATASLAQEKESAIRANVAKSRFLAAASHDLRQPMHALGLFVAALKDRARDAETRELVEHIEASSQAMEALLNSLLDISRLEAGAIEPRLESFRVARLLHSLRRQFSMTARERGIELVVVESRLAIHSDPLLLERILSNLVSNALRYTERGRVLVGCRPRGAEVRIEVWDTGRGIPESQLDAVFEEFVQLHNPERDRDKGLGLGLAIVARLVKLLGHTLDFRSREGHGSMFAVCVPLASSVEDDRREAPREVIGNPLAGALVVMVDDEPEIVAGTGRLFDAWGMRATPAASGVEAMARLDALGAAPDVIVSDYRLREAETGVEVVERLRARYGAHIPALLVSGDTAPATLRALAGSGLPHLAKPLRPAKLRALLSQMLQEARRGTSGEVLESNSKYREDTGATRAPPGERA
jgi:signal transduction histidine kinase/FixJ family two-component response regulator